MLVLYLFQIHLFQTALEPNTFVTRLLGLSQIVYTDCEQPLHLFVNVEAKWQEWTQPFLIFALYWFIAVEFSYFSEKMRRQMARQEAMGRAIVAVATAKAARAIRVNTAAATAAIRDLGNKNNSNILTDTDTDDTNEKQVDFVNITLSLENLMIFGLN